MKAYELPASSDPADADEQNAWERLSADQFLSGYAAADAVYDRP
jgi:hypothetical protein